MDKKILEIEDIKKILPQRYPFLMIDRVIEHSPEKVVVFKLKNKYLLTQIIANLTQINADKIFNLRPSACPPDRQENLSISQPDFSQPDFSLAGLAGRASNLRESALRN